MKYGQKEYVKGVEFQIDRKSLGVTIRVNVMGLCKFRICGIPEHLVNDNGLTDITITEAIRELLPQMIDKTEEN